MHFEWDDYKSEVNLQKHKISFEEVLPVFFDEHALYYEDERENYGEQRMILIGSSNERVIYVAYVEIENDVIRIISARKANSLEIRAYQQGFKQ